MKKKKTGSKSEISWPGDDKINMKSELFTDMFLIHIFFSFLEILMSLFL